MYKKIAILLIAMLVLLSVIQPASAAGGAIAPKLAEIKPQATNTIHPSPSPGAFTSKIADIKSQIVNSTSRPASSAGATIGTRVGEIRLQATKTVVTNSIDSAINSLNSFEAGISGSKLTDGPAAALEALAIAGAFGCFGLSRRAALWAAGAVASLREGQLPGTATGMTAPPLPAMTPTEETLADLWATSTYGTHPVAHIRAALQARQVLPAAALKSAPDGADVAVAGLVTHRQRPPTARGVVFLSLEDETGMVNVICPPQVWERHQRMATVAPALLVQGHLERAGGAVNLVADALRPLRPPSFAGAAAVPSRDFR